MVEQAFNDLFGTTGPDGRKPKVCAATGRPLQKTDHRTRQRIEGTKLYVFYTRPLSAERLAELVKLAQSGPVVKAAKAPEKDK